MVAWLIEMDDAGRPTYWSRVDNPDGVCGWSKDHDKAIRFCRREDAQAVIDDMGWTEPRPVEHAWAASSVSRMRARTTGIIGIPRPDGSRPR
jgi:hypothetical protein